LRYAPRRVDRKSDSVLSCRTTGLMDNQHRRRRLGIQQLAWSLNGKRRTDASSLGPNPDYYVIAARFLIDSAKDIATFVCAKFQRRHRRPMDKGNLYRNVHQNQVASARTK
jgi:hypothetical protein